jgi:hypothetical protein
MRPGFKAVKSGNVSVKWNGYIIQFIAWLTVRSDDRNVIFFKNIGQILSTTGHYVPDDSTLKTTSLRDYRLKVILLAFLQRYHIYILFKFQEKYRHAS